jgi:2,3-bisphosphoglycerate-independent phosphoglycerate mutase
MKSIVIIGDGMSDLPLDRLDGKTPLMVARKPHIDRIAREGRTGLLRTIGASGPADSAVANLAVLGYGAEVSREGRAVLEAASMGVEIGPGDVSLRCNLVCLEGPPDDRRIRNHSAGHIPTAEAAELIASLDAALGGGRGQRPVRFHAGVSYRHLLVLEGGWASAQVVCAPPHDHVGERAFDLLPRLRPDLEPAELITAAITAERLRDLHREAAAILADHPVNAARRRRGLDEAGSIWTWSPGRRPTMRTLRELYGVRGAVISAVDLIRGLGVYAGLDVIQVAGATGLHDTNYEGKAQACLDALADHDFVYVHVEATDEAAHARDLELKIRCIESLDERLVRPVLAGLEARYPTAAVAILPDHPTPVETGQHGRDPVPVAIRRPGTEPDAVQGYDEQQVRRGALGLLEGDAFIRLALDRAR